MKVLFLTDEFYPDFGANSLVVNSLCKELVKEGHIPYVMPFTYNKKYDEFEQWKGIQIIRKVQVEDTLLFYNELKKGHFRDSANIAFNMIYSKFVNDNDFRFKERVTSRKIIAEIISQEKIDIVVSICCSIELSLPLLYLREHGNLTSKWILYFIDPFEGHTYYRKHYSQKVLRKWQHRLMKASDRVIVTDLIYEELKKWETTDIIDKNTVVEFPKIEKRQIEDCPDDILLSRNSTNVVCTGTRNEIERNSDFILAVCRGVRDRNIKFHFIGGGWAYKEAQTKGNIIFHPPCSFQASINAQLRADYLINIGNSAVNQLPSKVLEYICSGKPIISTFKSKDCPAIRLLKSYDALLIDENNESIDGAIIKMENFICSNHKKLEFQEIETRYKEYTPSYCTKKFFDL